MQNDSRQDLGKPVRRYRLNVSDPELLPTVCPCPYCSCLNWGAEVYWVLICRSHSCALVSICGAPPVHLDWEIWH